MTRARSVVALAGALLVLGLALVMSSAFATTPQPARNLVATGPDGRSLAADPLLRSGERITIVARAFAAKATVTGKYSGGAILGHYRASSAGTVTLSFVVPAALTRGGHKLIFVGVPTVTRRTLKAKTGPGDNQYVEAVVPRLDQFPFRTGPNGGPGAGVSGVATSRPGGGHGHGTGGLAFTGADVLGLAFLGLLAIVIGVFASRGGRRRFSRPRA